MPVQRRQLSFTKLPEDEASGDAYEELQEKDKWWLSYLQTTDCVVLLSRETLPRNEVSRSILLQHQTQDKATTVAATITASTTAQVSRIIDFLCIIALMQIKIYVLLLFLQTLFHHCLLNNKLQTTI